MNPTVVLVLIFWLVSGLKQQFPVEGDCDLVDKRGSYNSNLMVTKTKQAYRDKKRCGALGSGKSRLKIMYQNGGNVIHTFDMIENIEKMMNNVRPHVMFMCENRMDEKTRVRLTNQHGFCVEEIAEGERIWAAIRGTVPYKRRRDYELIFMI